MANWSILKTAIADVVKTNGNQEITGAALQSVLNNIVNNVGENATFAGIATPATNPGTPDGPVFYLATTAGSYSNFGGITISEEESVILQWKGNAWLKTIYGLVTTKKFIKADTVFNLKKSDFYIGSLQGGGTGTPIAYNSSAYSIFIPVVNGARIKFIYPLTVTYNGNTYNVGVRVQARKRCNFEYENTNRQNEHTLIYPGYGTTLDTLTISSNYNYISFGLDISNLPSYIKAIDIIEDNQFSIQYKNDIYLAPNLIDDYNYIAALLNEKLQQKINITASTIGKNVNALSENVNALSENVNALSENVNALSENVNALNSSAYVPILHSFSNEYTSSLLMLNGTIYSQHSPAAYVSEKIYIDSNVKRVYLKDIYCNTGVWKQRAVIAFYNSEDICLKTYAFTSLESFYDEEYNIEDNTSYIRVSYVKNSGKKLQLFFGISSGNFVNSLNIQSECYTAASESTKVIEYPNFTLTTGARILVKMVNGNTANNVKLNINNTGKKDLYINNVLADNSGSWLAGDVLEMYYDGAQYQAKFFNKNEEVSIFDLNPKTNVVELLLQANRVPRIVGTSTPTTPPLVLSIITDIHGRMRQMKRFVKFNEYYSDYIADAIHLGDSIYDYHPTHTMEFWNQAGANAVLNVIGNHDTYIYPGGTKLDNISTYNKYFLPYIALWNVTQPDNAAAEGLCYYYKDYTANNVRLIVLDIMHYGENNDVQRTWFQQTLSSAKEQGLSVIVAQHYQFNIIEFDTSWNSWLSENRDAYNFVNDVDNFIASGGEFICHLCGHTHFSKIGTIDGHSNQIMIVFDTGAGDSVSDKSGSAWCDRARNENTKAEDLFNILSVNTYSKTFSIFRVGSEVDSQLRYQRTICIDYKNRALIYSN